MSDVYTSVTNRSFGSNIVDSIKSFFIGLLMFIASFPILWWNEGRTDMSQVAKTATVITADGQGSAGEGKLVSVTGDIKGGDEVGDPDYLKPGAYLKLTRKVEMYAWVETKEKRTEKQLGGGSKEITTFKYDLQWTSSPQSTSNFEHPEGHSNPSLHVEHASWYAKSGFVGAYQFDPHSAELPPAKSLTIEASMMKTVDAPKPVVSATASAAAKAPKNVPAKVAPKPKASASAAATASARPTDEDEDASPPGVALSMRLNNGYLFHGNGSVDQPKLGDVRVSYDAVDAKGGPFTLYGVKHGNQVNEFANDNGDKLYRVVTGTHEQAIALLHMEHTMTTWLLRGLGFFFMWIGLALTIAPINTVLDVVPFVGSAGRFITGVVMFPIALVLSGVTIILSIVAHNPLLLIVPVVLLLGIFVLTKVMRKPKTA